ncbi:hypothetical protein D1007_21760 [Hordeum vulgare]|nr:hypothetical protein D1007_21760 [Hordeum vulgare]
MCMLIAETRIGSDYVPLILSLGKDRIKSNPRFYFETGWLEIEGFIPLVIARSELAIALSRCQQGPMDLWIMVVGMLRSFLRGWGANYGSKEKRAREALIKKIKTLEAQVDTRVFSEAEWANHYTLENQVLSILREEEEYWHRRGGVKWVTKGDANTG